MNKECPTCSLINFRTATTCQRCQTDLREITAETSAKRIVSRRRKYLTRLMMTPFLVIFLLLGFYLSLRLTAEPLTAEQDAALQRALTVLEERGFASEARMLRYTATYRRTDNWLNRRARFENAYAAVNFPFQIVTLYPDFFEKPTDDTERALILLHEAQHLYGADEPEAYEYAWRKRRQLGWTKEAYSQTRVWNNVSEATHNYAPRVFQCGLELNEDCTEINK
jgi:hypothetical protein